MTNNSLKQEENMNYDIETIFKGRKAVPIGDYIKSAVAIILVEEQGKQCIIFEERAHFLKKQPGDICLPGGKVEKGEAPRETVIREIFEELGIINENIEVIEAMDYYISPYNSIIYPFIIRAEGIKMIPNLMEVDHILTIPLDYFMSNEPMLYKLEIGPCLKEDFPYHLIRGGKDYKFGHGVLKEYFYIYEDYVIWGFTAMIIKRFVNILKNNKL